MAFISTERVLSKLDEHLNRNDYDSAKKHLLYWLDEAKAADDKRTRLLILNELAGLYRKLAKKDENLTRSVSAELESHAYSVNERIKDSNIRNINILYAV